MMLTSLSEAQEASIRPIRFLAVGELAQAPAPLVRVSTCGLLTLEVFEEIVSTDPPQARYRVLTPEHLHGRGVQPALTLLKLLCSRPERFASAEWLREQFCQAQGEAFSSKRLDSLASFLRDLLCPPVSEHLRTTLVANTRAMSGSGYHLAAYPLIWVDHEALAWNVEQAIRLERFGDDPLPFWQRAYELAKRGEYLPDELYGEWASVKREQIAGMLRQSVQALARIYANQGDKASEEEALLLLRTYWQEHPHDEDALRPLMELLARRECYQEALAYYEKLCNLLEEEGEQPVKQTQDVAAYVRAKQIQRTPRSLQAHCARGDIFSQETLPTPDTMALPPALEEQRSVPPSHTFVHLLPFEMASIDGATWIGVRLAHILSLIHQWSRQALSCDILQAITDREIAMFDDLRGMSSEDVFLLSRRQALVTLAGLPTMLASLFQEQSVSLRAEEFLPQCAASITACWHLLRGREFLLIEKLLTHYLPTLAHLAHQPSLSQVTAASLASQGYRLIGIVALHRNHPQAREAYFQQAVHFAEIANHPGLLAAAFISLAYHHETSPQTLSLYHRGLSSATDLSPLLCARLYARIAVASSQQGQEQEALRYLDAAKKAYPDHPGEDPSFLYAEFDPASLIMEEGLAYLALAQHDAPHYAQQAWQTLEQMNELRQFTPVPARISCEIINHQAKVALVMKDLERFSVSLEKGVQGARDLQSEQRQQEAISNYRAAKKVWPEEKRIQALADLFL